MTIGCVKQRVKSKGHKSQEDVASVCWLKIGDKPVSLQQDNGSVAQHYWLRAPVQRAHLSRPSSSRISCSISVPPRTCFTTLSCLFYKEIPEILRSIPASPTASATICPIRARPSFLHHSGLAA